MRFSTDYPHDVIDKEWNKWNNFNLKLQGRENEVGELQDDNDEADDGDGKRRRRSRFDCELKYTIDKNDF